MIDDDTLEELTAYAATLFAQGQRTDEFIKLMQEKWHNINPYILGIVFRSIRSHSDMLRADMMGGA